MTCVKTGENLGWADARRTGRVPLQMTSDAPKNRFYNYLPAFCYKLKFKLKSRQICALASS